MLFDLTSAAAASGTVPDPPGVVTLEGPAGARGAVTVTRGGDVAAVHTFKVVESPRALPADWFEAGDTVDVVRWVE
jgi:hypothetical protein